MEGEPDQRPFEFACSTLPFGALNYTILSRKGNRLNALVRGSASPSTPAEDYFVRCIHHGADYDSHQCDLADAWRKLVERREFERDHRPPGQHRTWVRAWELRDGMILFPPDRTATLLTPAPGHEVRGQGRVVQYRNSPDLPWHRTSEGGRWRVVVSLKTKKRSELFTGSEEILQAADGLDRVMTFVRRNSDHDDMVILDTDSNDTYCIPPERVSRDIYEPGALHPYALVRVQWWQGEPLWVWGPA